MGDKQKEIVLSQNEKILNVTFFPLMELKEVYHLKYGEIGPIKKLIPSHPILADILPALMQTTIDGNNLKDPVVAISNSNSQKFISELECLCFSIVCEPNSVAEEEIFGQKSVFMISEKNNRIYFNKYSWISPVKQLQKIRFQDFPKSYFRWDKEKIAKFEAFFAKVLRTKLYSSLTECLSDDKDKETQRERSRIIISIALFNQAHIGTLLQPFSKNHIVFIAAAFEALLNLPSEAIQKNFQNGIMMLIGKRTSLLKKWCTDFYGYRSSLVHGDIAWEEQANKESFRLSDDTFIDHSRIASSLFVRCLKAKLFLAGMLKNYKPEGFTFSEEYHGI